MTLQANEYPGTAHHQQVLRAVVDYYAPDPRVLAVLVFGSLGRGTWDCYSDLDLDIVLADDVTVTPAQELERLCATFAAIGERAALIVPKRTEEGDIVLASLLQLSVRFHALASTSPNIVDSLRLLGGYLDEEVIRAAGRANGRQQPEAIEVLRDRCLRSLVEVDVALHRRRLWFAVEHLGLARDNVIELFAAARGGMRPLHCFQCEADPSLQARVGATLPAGTLAQAQRALLQFLDLLEQDLYTLSSGRVGLTEVQRDLLKQIRMRQAALVIE